ncbi:hypothetical protein D3C78_1860250 [compost metagenome]
MFEPCEQCRFLAEIAGKGDDQYVIVGLGNVVGDGFGGVAAAVVDEDDFDSHAL